MLFLNACMQWQFGIIWAGLLYAFRLLRIKKISSLTHITFTSYHLLAFNTFCYVLFIIFWALIWERKRYLTFSCCLSVCFSRSCKFPLLQFLVCQWGPLWGDLSSYFSLWPCKCRIVWSTWQKGQWLSLICSSASLFHLCLLQYILRFFCWLHPEDLFRHDCDRSVFVM